MSTPKRPTKMPAPQPPELAAIEQPAEIPTPTETVPPTPTETVLPALTETVPTTVAPAETETVVEQSDIEQPIVPSAPDDLVAHSIMVRCTRPTGIWRGGRFWTAEQVTVPLDELTEEQIERIVTEPLLDFAFVAGEQAE